jgi:hypothetical protein
MHYFVNDYHDDCECLHWNSNLASVKHAQWKLLRTGHFGIAIHFIFFNDIGFYSIYKYVLHILIDWTQPTSYTSLWETLSHKIILNTPCHALESNSQLYLWIGTDSIRRFKSNCHMFMATTTPSSPTVISLVIR